MKRALVLCLLATLVGGCVVTPVGYGYRDGYRHGYYRGYDYHGGYYYRDRDHGN